MSCVSFLILSTLVSPLVYHWFYLMSGEYQILLGLLTPSSISRERKSMQMREDRQTDMFLGSSFRIVRKKSSLSYWSFSTHVPVYQPMPLMWEWIETDWKMQWCSIPHVDSKVK